MFKRNLLLFSIYTRSHAWKIKVLSVVIKTPQISLLCQPKRRRRGEPRRAGLPTAKKIHIKCEFATDYFTMLPSVSTRNFAKKTKIVKLRIDALQFKKNKKITSSSMSGLPPASAATVGAAVAAAGEGEAGAGIAAAAMSSSNCVL